MLDRIAIAKSENNRNRPGRGTCRQGGPAAAVSCNQLHFTVHQVGRKGRKPIVLTACPSVFNRDVRPLDIAYLTEALLESTDVVRPCLWRPDVEESDYRHGRLLRPCYDRPRRRAAEQRDELATADHSITSSARASSMAGISRPIPFAVARLMIKSNLLACSTGRSPAFSPLRIRAT